MRDEESDSQHFARTARGFGIAAVVIPIVSLPMVFVAPLAFPGFCAVAIASGSLAIIFGRRSLREAGEAAGRAPAFAPLMSGAAMSAANAGSPAATPSRTRRSTAGTGIVLGEVGIAISVVLPLALLLALHGVIG